LLESLIIIELNTFAKLVGLTLTTSIFSHKKKPLFSSFHLISIRGDFILVSILFKISQDDQFSSQNAILSF